MLKDILLEIFYPEVEKLHMQWGAATVKKGAGGFVVLVDGRPLVDETADSATANPPQDGTENNKAHEAPQTKS